MSFNMYKMIEEFNKKGLNITKKLEKDLLWSRITYLKLILKMINNNILKDYKEKDYNLFLGLTYKEMLIVVTIDKYNINTLIHLLEDIKLAFQLNADKE